MHVDSAPAPRRHFRFRSPEDRSGSVTHRPARATEGKSCGASKSGGSCSCVAAPLNSTPGLPKLLVCGDKAHRPSARGSG